jgi:hypothetical protein
MQKPYKNLDEALILVKNAVLGEREDESFYDHLISMASTQEAKVIATVLGIDFSKERFDLEEFRKGLDVELEHGRKNN